MDDNNEVVDNTPAVDDAGVVSSEDIASIADSISNDLDLEHGTGADNDDEEVVIPPEDGGADDEPKDETVNAPDNEPKDDEPKDEEPKEDLPKDESLPDTWRPEALEALKNADPLVQEEVAKREQEMAAGISMYKEAAGQGAAFNQILEPFAESMQQAGVNPFQEVSSLLQTREVLLRGAPEQKLELLYEIADTFGVDISQERPYVDPAAKRLQMENSELKSELTAAQQKQADDARTQIQAEITKFAENSENEFFDEVSGEMAVLMRGDENLSLKDAYDKAVWANPATRQKLIERQAASAEEKRKKDEQEAVERAKAASKVNVKSRPRKAGGAATDLSLDDAVEASMKEVLGRN